MKALRTIAIVVASASLLVPAAGHAAGQQTFVVDNTPGDNDCPKPDSITIQGAVAAAPPGSKILVCSGVYAERVTITKHDLRIEAQGTPGSVILDGGAPGHGPLVAGFDLVGASDIVIDGFLIRDYHEADILLTNSDSNTLRMNVLTTSGHDGIELINSSYNVVEQNTSFLNDGSAFRGCGIDILDTAHVSTGNIIRYNVTNQNPNSGIRLLNAGTDNVVFHNVADDNGTPPAVIAGRPGGIVNANTPGTVITDNRTYHNRTNGIRVGMSAGVVLLRNHSFENGAFDISIALSTPIFDNNHCLTGDFPGICEQYDSENTTRYDDDTP